LNVPGFLTRMNGGHPGFEWECSGPPPLRAGETMARIGPVA
jgi:hypothetical protein